MRSVKSWLCALIVLVVGGVQAQFQFSFGGPGQKMESFSGTVRLEPAYPVVGIPCAFVFKFTTKDRIEIQQVMGLPDRGVEYLADSVEPFADGTCRLPVRFTEPLKQTLNVVVGGMQTVERGNGTAFRSSFSTNFRKALPPLKLDVRPLPEDGKPADFSGAVGTRFSITQKLTPDHVRPGDLVTATYELNFEGYCPSNVWPTVERLSKEFKAYDPKEVERTAKRVKWTQVLVPRTVAATNSAMVSFSYYNPHLCRYETAQSRRQQLVFVSAEAASTQNTSVSVTGESTAKSTGAAASGNERAPLVLRFAPSETSPAVATLPPGTPVVELSKLNGWRRVSAGKAIGWAQLQ